MAWALALLLASACAASPSGPPRAAALRKCCPAGQQLSIDLRTCLPLPPPARRPPIPTYATETASAPADDAAGRARRGLEDWGWLPEDAVITDSASLEAVTLEDLRRAARDADRKSPRSLPGVESGAPPPCSSHETELLFWDDTVQLFSNGSLEVTQHRPDLFRPPSMTASSEAAEDGGDEGERSFLFPAGSFCMDRLAAPQSPPLDDQDVSMEVAEAVAAETALNDTSHVVLEAEDADNVIHVLLLCPCSARGMRCVRKCCHPRSVLVVDAKGDTECRFDPQQPQQSAGDGVEDGVASAADFNEPRELAAREWGPSQHRHPDEINSGRELFLLHALPHCSNPEGRRFLLNAASLFNSSQSGQFWIMDDGSAAVDSFGVDHVVPAGAFCGEVALDAATGLRAANLLVCADPGVLASSSAARVFYAALAATGAAFLAATLLVHAALPELRRSLHSSNLMAHTGSLLVAYVALTVNELASPALPHVACLVLAFVLQFSFLAAFFWLNVMCVDISWAFSGLRLPQGSAAERDRKKFLWYSLYAWGSSAAITGLTVAMHFLPASTPHALHPQIGVVSCWFKEKTTVLIYFYGPMAFLLLANLMLFVYTAARILAVRKDTAILHKADNARNHTGSETQRLVLYVKLFGLMGLTWVTEIVSWAAGGRDYYWYATDVINLLRAVFIFVIFCCKRKVLRLMLDRFSSDGGADTSGSRAGRSGVGPRMRGRGAGTMTSSLTFQQDARRLQHTGSQDSSMTTVTSPTPTSTPDNIMLTVR